jgi:hypothetical protein
MVTATVYLERALINPAGVAAPGREAVVLGNLATAAQSVYGWQLVDRKGR